MKGKRSYRVKLKTSKTKYIVLLFILTLIILSGILIARSKYVLKSDVIGMIEADTFYFNSYTLSEIEKQISSDNIEFKLFNYEDALRASSANIEYEIKTEIVSPKDDGVTAKVTINGEEKSNGILEGGEQSIDTIKVEVQNNGTSVDEASVRVYAIAKSPYTKTISAVYNMKKNENSSVDGNYEVNLVSKEQYENLLIRTTSYSGSLKVTYDNTKLRMYDERKENIDISGNVVTINVNKSSNYSVKFVKLTTDKIELNKDITITK